MNKFTYFLLAALPAMYCTSCSDSREAAQESIANIQESLKECIENNKNNSFEDLVDDMHSEILPELKALVASLEDMSPGDKFEVWRTMKEADGIKKAWREELERRFPDKNKVDENGSSSLYYYRPRAELLLDVYADAAKGLPMQTKLQLLDLAEEYVKYEFEIGCSAECSAEFKKLKSEYREKKWQEEQKKREEEAKKKAEEAMGGNNENYPSSYQPKKYRY